MSRISSVSKELQLAALAAIALAVSLLLPWYQKSYFQDRQVVQANVSALGVFTFVEAAVLLVAAAVLFLVWARSQRKGFHLPGGDGIAITIAGCWAMLLLVWRLFDKPDIQGAGATDGNPVGIFAAMVAAGALIAAGARVRALRAPSRPTRQPTTSSGSRRSAASASARRTAGPATRPRSPRCCATARRGRVTRARRRSTSRARRRSASATSPRRMGEVDPSRLFEDPSRAKTTRLGDEETTRLPEESLRRADQTRAAAGRHAPALGRRFALTRRFGELASDHRPIGR